MKSISNFVDAARGVVFNTSDTVHNLVFSGAAKTVTVPSGATIASFSATGTFYVDFNGSPAVIPTVDVTNGTGEALNPTVRNIAGLSTFSVIAGAGVIVAISFYNA